MTTLESAAGPLPNVSNYQIIRRLLIFMRPLTWWMMFSLSARVIKLCGQAAVLGIAAASIGIYVQNSVPGVVQLGRDVDPGGLDRTGGHRGCNHLVHRDVHRPLRRLPYPDVVPEQIF